MELVILLMSLNSQLSTGASQQLVQAPHQSKALQQLPISGLDPNQPLKQAKLKTITTPPRGAFALRHLFPTALSNTGEQTLLVRAVRERLRYLLTHEDTTTPLGDAASATTRAGEDIHTHYPPHGYRIPRSPRFRIHPGA